MKKIRIYDSDKFPDLFENQQVRVFQLPDLKVCIAKFRGDYFAFEYLCPHQKHPLKDAMITEFGEVVCPLHEFRFSLDLGEEANNKCALLKRYTLYLKPEGVYLEI